MVDIAGKEYCVDNSATSQAAGVYMYKSSEAPKVPLRPVLIMIPSDPSMKPDDDTAQ